MGDVFQSFVRVCFGLGRLKALEWLEANGRFGGLITFLGILSWCLGVGFGLRQSLFDQG